MKGTTVGNTGKAERGLDVLEQLCTSGMEATPPGVFQQTAAPGWTVAGHRDLDMKGRGGVPKWVEKWEAKT